MNALDNISWFIGLCDGEACFSMKEAGKATQRLQPRFQIIMEEDEEFFDRIRDTLGCGKHRKIPPKPRKGGGYYNTRRDFLVESEAELLKVCDFFQQFPLHSKKAREFPIWSELVHLWVEGKSGTREAWLRTLDLAAVANRRGGRSKDFQIKLRTWLSPVS